MDKFKNQNFVRKYFKSIIWAALILYLSLANLNDNELVKELFFPYSDKIAHIGIYVLFTFILLSEYKTKGKQLPPLIFSIFYGILMEFLQYILTTYRSLELLDILANTSGAFAAWYIYKNLFTDLKQR
ncbi:MAG: VanZ family protein [Bacteroidales bacterium]|nr:VanZ family protein [Bacteroidales bacterium]